MNKTVIVMLKVSKDDYSIVVVEGHELQNRTYESTKSPFLHIPSQIQDDLYLPFDLLSKHCLMLGSIGSGKSNIMFHTVSEIKKNLGENDCMIYFDSKGDYVEKFCDSKDIIVGNSEWVKSKFSSGHIGYLNQIKYWNIFSDLSITVPLESIREISTSLFKKTIESAQNPIFPRGARDMFAAIMFAFYKKSKIEIGTGRYIILNGKKMPLDNHTLKCFFESFSIEQFSNLIGDISEVEWVKTYISSGAKTNTTQSYLTYLNAIPQEIFTSDFCRAGDFSIREFVNNGSKQSLFLEYDIANSNTIDIIYTVLLDIAMKEALGKRRQGNIYFILDEFPLIPKLSYFDNLLNFGRSLGVKVIAGIQNVGQVYSKYDLYLGNSILSGFSNYFAFKLFDQSSRDVVKQRHGKNRTITSVKKYGVEGYDIKIQENDVIADWVLTSLDIGQCVVSIPSTDPFVFKATEYESGAKGKIKIKRGV